MEITPSTTTMEEHQYSKTIDSIPTFSGQQKENITDWLEIVSLKFDIIVYDSQRKPPIHSTILDWKCFELTSRIP